MNIRWSRMWPAGSHEWVYCNCCSKYNWIGFTSSHYPGCRQPSNSMVSPVPNDFIISVSKNGWTSDTLGLEWLQTVFEPYTVSHTLGRHCMLILDGHSSHATAEFNIFCTERNIIPLYMASTFISSPAIGCWLLFAIEALIWSKNHQ